MTRQSGLTVLEVILALAVMGIVMSLFSTSFVGSMKVNSVSGQRTQAVQLLGLVGRLANGGLNTETPIAQGDVITWDYGQLAGKLPQVAPDGNQSGSGSSANATDFADIDLYKVTITNSGTITFIGSTLTQFDISVCWETSGQETCARGSTIGPVPQTPTTPPSS